MLRNVNKIHFKILTNNYEFFIKPSQIYCHPNITGDYRNISSIVLRAFAILLIPMAIMGFKFWGMIRLAQKQQNGDVIEAQYTVIEKRDDDL